MASIYQRDNPEGKKVWRAVIRKKGYPTVCSHFDRKQEAQDWTVDVERKITMGDARYNAKVSSPAAGKLHEDLI